MNNSKLNTEEIYQALRGKLASLEFKPGRLLSEKEIASYFRVSRTPIRNVFFKLERDGLIEIIPRKGALIKFLSMKDIFEIFEIRKALESLAARHAAKNINFENLKQFEDYYINVLQKGLSNENLQAIIDFGVKFHEFIIESADIQRIKRILGDLRVQLGICRIFFLNQNTGLENSRAVQSIREHMAIIEAFKKMDEDLAETRMKEHITNAEKYTFFSQQRHGTS